MQQALHLDTWQRFSDPGEKQMQLSDTTMALLNFDAPQDIGAEMRMMAKRWLMHAAYDYVSHYFAAELSQAHQHLELQLPEVSPTEGVCLVQKQNVPGWSVITGADYDQLQLYELRDVLGFPLLAVELVSEPEPE
jgi:hypothetical protein